ncbi:hypothetical protein ACLK1T_17070 [Escherichia coli]
MPSFSRRGFKMVARYGKPNHLNEREGGGFAVVGYGKLGGWGSGYSSDLDLLLPPCLPNGCDD